MKTTPQALLKMLLVAAASLGLLGCKTLNKPASASFASVRIQGHTPEQIRATAVVVFQQDGYAYSGFKDSQMVFEKEGSRWDQIAYGSWVNGGGVWVRVRASVVPLSGDSYRLQCQAYTVRNKGDPLTEDEVRVKERGSKPYQALLDKVLGQMKR